ncbi:hypothetical protein GGQ68_003991 [Sagittula marina]|uniref:Uncharacterized protein n=1 Tax=Sagittula marina TaxID=943940 RepID=A0A7W6DYH8_9RHOB|nr:hypothetical protein [Sagittula marina]MBB3987644.1 hypothetical protein [Sagittula marina]
MSQTDNSEIRAALTASASQAARQVLLGKLDRLPTRAAQLVRAEIALQDGMPEDAIAAVIEGFGESPEAPGPAKILAEAFLECNDPASAHRALAKHCDSQGFQMLRAQLSVVAALGDQDATVALAVRACEAFEDRPAMVEHALLCLARVDALDAIWQLFNTSGFKAVKLALRQSLIESCLRCGSGAVLARFLAWWEGDSVASLLGALSSFDADRRHSVLAEAAHNLPVGRALFFLGHACDRAGLEDIGQDILNRCRSHQAPQVWPKQAQSLTPQRESLLAQSYEKVLRWLDVAERDRAEWLTRLDYGMRLSADVDFLYASDPAFRADFDSRRRAPDLGPLKALADAGQRGILATAHTGLVMQITTFFQEAGLTDVTMIGGHPCHRKIYPGGQMLHPMPPGGHRGYAGPLARKALAENGIVALAVDLDVTPMMRLRHHGVEVSLPTTVPRLALQCDAPLIWGCSHLRGEEIHYDCTPLPTKHATETDERFYERVLLRCLDLMRDACLRDPANAGSAAKMLARGAD